MGKTEHPFARFLMWNVSVIDLTFDEYQKKAYVSIQPHTNNKEEVIHWTVGLGEEAGEVLGVVKHKYYGGQYSVEDMVGELGDVLWHVAALCTSIGLEMSDVAEYNLAKLLFRYPDGFDISRSQARHQIAGDFKRSEAHDTIMERIKEKMAWLENYGHAE